MDTGLGDGLWLFENDSLKCSKVAINDVLGRGLGGDVLGKKSRVKRLVSFQVCFTRCVSFFS